MHGRRIQPGKGIFWQPGDYWFRGHWMAVTPNGMLANLSAHMVIEHEDGTITVSPSIATSSSHDQHWHGFLERGVWREV